MGLGSEGGFQKYKEQRQLRHKLVEMGSLRTGWESVVISQYLLGLIS